MDEEFSIRVKVADRYYPLRIARKDEEMVRMAAQGINDKLLQYEKRYADMDSQDFLAMALLQYGVKLINCEKNADISSLLEDIGEINRELEEYLSID
jgi:cell division protein ZapA